MARIAKHLGVQLSLEPECPVRLPCGIGVDTADLNESKANSTSSGDDSLTESAPF